MFYILTVYHLILKKKFINTRMDQLMSSSSVTVLSGSETFCFFNIFSDYGHKKQESSF